MKNLFQLLLISIMFSSCAPEILDNQRAYVEATLKDAAGAPLSNVEVRLANYVEDCEGPIIFIPCLNGPSITLGEARTDENGLFKITSLVTKTDVVIEFLDTIGEKRFYLIPMDRWNNRDAIIIPELIVKELAQVSINFNNTSGVTDEFPVTTDYINPSCLEVLENNSFDGTINCNNFQRRVIPFTEEQIYLNVLYPSAVAIEFTSNGQLVTREFMITNPNETFNVDY